MQFQSKEQIQTGSHGKNIHASARIEIDTKKNEIAQEKKDDFVTLFWDLVFGLHGIAKF